MNEEQKEVSSRFNNRGVWYMPGLTIALDSIQASLVLSQLLFWHGKGGKKGGWIYKTIDELYRETGLKRSGQETAIKCLKDLGLLEVKLMGIPAKRHFRISLGNIHRFLDSLLETDELGSLDNATQSAGNQQSITENTQKITHQNTTKKINQEANEFLWMLDETEIGITSQNGRQSAQTIDNANLEDRHE